MSEKPVPITQQGKNYATLFWRLMLSYYRCETGSFWLIQFLMGASVLLGLIWLLGIIAGVNHLHDANYLQQYGVTVLADFFNQPVPVWLSLLSLAGIASALLLYASFEVGVRSAIRYQKHLIARSLNIVSEDKDFLWVQAFPGSPRSQLNRIIKLGVQLTGLVARRISRVFIPLITFIIAFVALIKLDGQLLFYILPLTVAYIVVLYFINRHAARIQVKLAELMGPVQNKLTHLIDSTLRQDTNKKPQNYLQDIEATQYHEFANLRYQRRLAEVHVSWLNTLFLVLASAVLVLVFKYVKAEASINWLNLILFLVALRYAASGLQQLSAATVGFSRFLPETEKVMRLLHLPAAKVQPQQIQGTIFCLMADNRVEQFELSYLMNLYPEHEAVVLDDLIESDQRTVQHYLKKTENALVVSNRPRQFINRVKQHQESIAAVLLCNGGERQCVTDVQQFLDTFDPDGFSRAAQMDDLDIET
ncbi:hypothetical protein [Marinicella sp. W31]|uniref:hypothetical protein n=1 Tax=Marinicella sp. W31 TaxID=3023713 RepID=UPI003757164B